MEMGRLRILPLMAMQVIVRAAAGSWLPGAKAPEHLQKSRCAEPPWRVRRALLTDERSFVCSLFAQSSPAFHSL